ncbi:MAG TPA: flagellin [Gemmatimonadales bacterium]
MRINTNVGALNAYRNLSETNNAVSSSMQKLSSGFRINRAADDAAGLGIANKLRADTRAMTQASKNAEQANSVLQIAEGGTGSIQKMLERMKELATQAGSDNVDGDGRARLQTEFKALQDEITRTVDTTMFQGKKLLAGGFGSSLNTGAASTFLTANGAYGAKVNGAAAGDYAVSMGADGSITLTNTTTTVAQTVSGLAAGKQDVDFSAHGITLQLDADFVTTAAANPIAGTVVQVTGGEGSFLVGSSEQYEGADQISIASLDVSLATLGVGGDVLTSRTAARTALDNIDGAMQTVNDVLGKIGATQNRVEFAQSNLKTSIQNFSAAESVIRDLDMAEEMTKFSKSNILAQAGTAMLAQANQSAQGVLQLLRG